MGARRLASLVEWLPPDAPLHRSMDPEGVGSGWTADAHLLALIAELQDVQNVILLNVYREKGVKVRDPIRIARPGRESKVKKDAAGKPVMASSDELQSFVFGEPVNVRRG
jgi:hypothetical protein